MKTTATVLIGAALILGVMTTPLFAKPKSRPNLQELQKTIEELKTKIEEQDKKIEALTQNTASKTPPDPSPDTLGKSSTDPKTTRAVGPLRYSVNPKGPSRLLPDISVIGVMSGAYFQHEPNPSGDHDAGHNPHRTGFNLQEIEIGFQSVIDPYLRGDVFLAVNEDGVELEEAYVTTLSLPKGLQLRAGKYKQPFGRQNQKHLERWAFVNDNLINHHFFGGDGFNELGIEASYLFPTPFFLQGQFSFSQGSNEGNFDGGRKQDFAYTGRVSTSVDLTPKLTALFGGSLAYGFNNTDVGESTLLLGGDFLLKWKHDAKRGIEWQTEYLYRKKQTPNGTEQEGGISSYAFGQWSKRWGAGLRLDYLGVPAELEKTLRLSPILSLSLTEFFKLRAQYDFSKTIGGSISQAAFLQLVFSMGPHGAHSF